MTDSEALNRLAAYLQTVEDWNGGDFCELAADLIERTGRSISTETSAQQAARDGIICSDRIARSLY